MKKKNNKLQKLRKRVNNLNDEKVEIGHFQEQGKHSGSDLPYPDLMAIHHFGLGGQLPRQLLTLLVLQNRKLTDPKFDALMKVWANSRLFQTDNEKLLSGFGKVFVKKEKELFGKAQGNLMPPTQSKKRVGVEGPHAPLVDTGELKSKVAFKTSIKNQVEEE